MHKRYKAQTIIVYRQLYTKNERRIKINRIEKKEVRNNAITKKDNTKNKKQDIKKIQRKTTKKK